METNQNHPHKYLILQFDEDDYYVPCPNREYWERLYNSIPDTSDFRGMHGSDTPEGRELTSNLSQEIFGRDLYAIMDNKELPPWNYKKFCDHILTIFGDSHISVGDTIAMLVVDKTVVGTTKNAKLIANQYTLTSKYLYPIPWVRVTDNDVNKMVTDIRKWMNNLPREVHTAWNIDSYYEHLTRLFGEVLIARDTTESSDPQFGKLTHDNIVLMRENFPVIVANQAHIRVARGTWTPWNQATSLAIQRATEYVTSLVNEMQGVPNEPEKPKPLAKGEWNFLDFLDYVKATETRCQIIIDKPRLTVYIAQKKHSAYKIVLGNATHFWDLKCIWIPWTEVTPEMVMKTLEYTHKQLETHNKNLVAELSKAMAPEKVTEPLTMVLGKKKECPFIMATYAEVMEWLAKGNGIARVQIASDSAVVSTILSCGESDLDLPINSSNLTNTMVRRFGDKEWHYPTYDYLKIDPRG